MTGEDIRERIEGFRSAVNESAALVRNLYFTFLLLGTYIAVTIGATTDEQLLKGAPVTLPIIGVDLPIFAFYGVIPWLLLLFHTNLLLHCYLLSRRIHLFNAALEGIADIDEQREHRIALFPFPFVQMMAGEPGARLTRWLSAVIVWVTIILLPLLLVVAAQVAFLPYHDITMTGWQRLAVLLDVVLIWLFWPLTVTPVGHSAWGWWSQLWRGPMDVIRRIFRKPGAPGPAVSARGMLPLLLVTLPVLLFSSAIAVIPGEPLERITVGLLPEAWRGGVDGDSSVLTDILFDAPGAILHRNLRLANRIIVAGDLSPSLEVALRSPWEEKRQEALAEIAGVVLANRDLRFADLRGALIPKANLQGVNLDGADLRQAELQAADLRGFDISAGGGCAHPGQRLELPDEAAKDASGLLLPEGEARICRVSLRRARLAEAQLIGARMALADLGEADLREVKLQSAGLRGANLDRARLGGASLTGATLRAASLVKADLSRARLNKSTLVEADLRAAILDGTRLEGADLTDARLEGWRVDGVTMDGAVFSRGVPLAGARIRSMARAMLEGADLSGAQLARVQAEGVLLRGANLRGANLERAKLRGALLAGADLSRAWLSGADLRLATLQGVDLRGATLSDADLSGSYLASSVLHGANLQAANLQLAMIRESEFTAADLAMARLGGAYIGSVRFDLADLRGLSFEAPGENGAKRTLDSLRFVQGFPNFLPPALVDYLQQWQEIGETGEDRMAYAWINAPVLCGVATPLTDPRQRSQCLAEADIDQFIALLGEYACADEAVAYGLAKRALRWADAGWLARYYHRGKKPDAYPRRLAEQLLNPSCEAGAKLPPDVVETIKALIADLAARQGSAK